MENVNTELTQADNTVQQDPATTAALLEQEIMAELQAGALQLKDGLPFGIGADCVMQYAVTFRELTTGDVIDAQTASEIPVTTAEGPMLVSSPSKMGVEMLRRSIATVGSINGPLSVALLRQQPGGLPSPVIGAGATRFGAGRLLERQPGASGCGVEHRLSRRPLPSA